ncbi:craniofacial development protein 2-like [Penaeus vannamei]|uniref:craniofacial development protein 2-like n=1 Tax=Penaeus vannamei TaxID=6689 RepID=UPI00387F90FD
MAAPSEVEKIWRFRPSVVEVTPVDEHIMVLRLKLASSLTSVIAVYASTDVCKLDVKEMFYTKLDSVADSCPRRDIRIVLGDFNAVSRSHQAGYEISHPDPHRWTWYSDTSNAIKVIDHILISTRLRIPQNCRVYRNAKFCGTDHRLVVATFRVPSSPMITLGCFIWIGWRSVHSG